MSANAAHRLPITMRTVFQDLLLITYAVQPAELAALLPSSVHPFELNGLSYISIVIGNMRGMRPHPLPEPLGTNYYQIVYRAVVRLKGADGTERPGVFFLRSDSNDPVMSFFGNRLTEFRFHYFHTGAIGLFVRGDELLVTVETRDGGGDLVLHLTDLGPAEPLPPAEGFVCVATEKELLVQLFHAFAYDPGRKLIYDLEIERGDWHCRRLRCNDSFTAFFGEGPFAAVDPKPVSSIYIRECAYVWKPMVAMEESSFIGRSMRMP